MWNIKYWMKQFEINGVKNVVTKVILWWEMTCGWSALSHEPFLEVSLVQMVTNEGATAKLWQIDLSFKKYPIRQMNRK